MWINRIKDVDLTHNRYSQAGEELVTGFIFEQIGTTDKFFVDLGASAYGEANPMSNTRLLKENGWSGVMIDMAARGNPDIKEYFLTPDNVCDILQKENVPGSFDFLSIDVDSFDFYILDRVLTPYRPRLICAEFNPSLPPNSSLVLKYEEGYAHDGTNKYGFSFGAGKKLLEYHGYTVLYNHLNQDIFAVRKDILDMDCQVTAEQIINFPINHKAEWVNY